MARSLITSTLSVTLIGGSPVTKTLLDAALHHAPEIIAADGGADQALRLGHKPSAIIGDMDSLASPQTWRNSGIRMFPIPEQETTDFEKCLYSIEAPLIIGCGFLGGRADHALAALSALLAYRARPTVLLGAESAIFHCPEELRIDLPAGAPVSFFPLLPVTGRVSEGLEWAIEGLALAPGGRIGTSNRALGGPLRAAFDGPGALVILPAGALGQAVAALSIRAR